MANLKENKKYHFTYKTANLINGRYYLGMHSTNRIDDGYIGSGKRLYYEISKYGKDNFKLEVLEYFRSREELVQAEINLITEEDLKNTNCLNLSKGGSGGIRGEAHYKSFVKGPKNIKPMLNKIAELKKDPEWVKWQRSLMTNGLRNYFKTSEGFFKGKKHSLETIEKMKQSHKGTGIGNQNSQYGTCWITNEIVNKKIKKSDIIPDGWRLGRIVNTSC